MKRLLIAVLGVGTALRLVEYASHPILSNDEAMLALNVLERSYGGLTNTLDWEQTAPVPFLWGVRLLAQALGATELVLRAIPFVAGALVPYGVWRVGRRVVSEPTAMLATALTACSPLLVHYGGNLKPYTLDALLALLVTGAALDVIGQAPTAWRRLAAAGVAAALGSQPAPFVLAAAGAALLLAPDVRRPPGGPWRVAALAATWGGVFAVVYFQAYHDATRSPYLHTFWAQSFLVPDSPAVVGRAWAAAAAILSVVFGSSRQEAPFIAIYLALIVGGWVVLARRRGPWAAALVAGPLAVAVLVSAVRRYPIAPRTMIFAVPLLALAAAQGAEALGERLRTPAWRRAGAAAVGVWLLALAAPAATHWHAPSALPELGRALDREAPAGAAVYVFSMAAPRWLFYTTDWRAPDTARLAWYRRIVGPGGPQFLNGAGRGRAVQGEGVDLVWHGRYTEVAGVRLGMQWRQVAGYSQPRPDSGWVENELERLRTLGRDDVWVLWDRSFPELRAAFLARLRDAGARVARARETRDVNLYQLEWGGP